MKKTILTILIAILALSPNKANASEKIASKVYQDDYYCYDADLQELILINDNLEPDENTERDYLLKNQANLHELDKMYLNYLNAKAINYTYYTLNILMKNIIRLNELMSKVPPNNKELDLQRRFYLNRLRWTLNEAEKYPPIGE